MFSHFRLQEFWGSSTSDAKTSAGIIFPQNSLPPRKPGFWKFWGNLILANVCRPGAQPHGVDQGNQRDQSFSLQAFEILGNLKPGSTLAKHKDLPITCRTNIHVLIMSECIHNHIHVYVSIYIYIYIHIYIYVYIREKQRARAREIEQARKGGREEGRERGRGGEGERGRGGE